MTPRRRALLIVGLILLLIGIIVAAVLLLRTVVSPTQPPAAPVEEVPAAIAPAPVVVDFESPLVLAAPPDAGRTAGQQMAELFAERYGSYSNQGDYQNLTDLLPVMTASYRQSTEAFLESADATGGQAFEGVTSVKVSTDVRSSDESSAIIAVTLQQERSSGSGPSTVGYRTLRMELERVGEDWRVDSASWEN